MGLHETLTRGFGSYEEAVVKYRELSEFLDAKVHGGLLAQVEVLLAMSAMLLRYGLVQAETAEQRTFTEPQVEARLDDDFATLATSARGTAIASMVHSLSPMEVEFLMLQTVKMLDGRRAELERVTGHA